MTSLDVNALTDDAKGLGFLAQVIGTQASRTTEVIPNVAMRFGANRSSVRRVREAAYSLVQNNPSRVAVAEMS